MVYSETKINFLQDIAPKMKVSLNLPEHGHWRNQGSVRQNRRDEKAVLFRSMR